jgi:hypothetical protein
VTATIRSPAAVWALAVSSEAPSSDRHRAVITTVSPSPFQNLRAPLTGPVRDAQTPRPVPAATLSLDGQRVSLGSLIEAPDAHEAINALEHLASGLGLSFDHREISPASARRGTVGRIGVPQDAVAVMRRQRVLVGAMADNDALAPVARLWRGLQRRADVLVDLQRSTGRSADRRGGERDLLLCAQRIVERTSRRVSIDAESAEQWTRARQTAELAYRIATAEGRQVLLVAPVGRGTDAQQFLAEAVERQARQQRAPMPRTVKAGLLAALLVGDHTREKLMVVSVMPMDELSALVTEAIGRAHVWPVMSLSADTSFYTIPVAEAGTTNFGALCLVLVSLIERAGRSDLAERVQQSLILSLEAAERMREELGSAMPVPHRALADAVLTNLDRALPGVTALPRRALELDPSTITGVRVRVETSLSAATLREQLLSALLPTGVDVASVRLVESVSAREDRTVYDVRLRTQLGETSLHDDAGAALITALGDNTRCISVEPWSPGSAERTRPTR